MSAASFRLPAGTAHGFRTCTLFLRQREVLWSLLALVVNAAVLAWLKGWVEVTGQEGRAIVLLMAAPALIACIVAVSAWSPSADLELASSFPLHWPRLLHLAGILVLGIVSSALVVDRWAVELAGDVPVTDVWVRNAIGLAGLALIQARFVHPRLAWLAPCLLAMIATITTLRRSDNPETLVNEQFQGPGWLFIARDHRSVVPWLIATGLLALGIFLIARYGPNVTEPGEQ